MAEVGGIVPRHKKGCTYVYKQTEINFRTGNVWGPFRSGSNEATAAEPAFPTVNRVFWARGDGRGEVPTGVAGGVTLHRRRGRPQASSESEPPLRAPRR